MVVGGGGWGGGDKVGIKGWSGNKVPWTLHTLYSSIKLPWNKDLNFLRLFLNPLSTNHNYSIQHFFDFFFLIFSEKI